MTKLILGLVWARKLSLEDNCLEVKQSNMPFYRDIIKQEIENKKLTDYFL